MKKGIKILLIVLAVIAVLCGIIVLAVENEQEQILSWEFDIEPTEQYAIYF